MALTNSLAGLTKKPYWFTRRGKDIFMKWVDEVETICATTATAVTDALTFGAAASTITVPTDGDAQDLTVQITGATNSSLILKSTGTAADALQIVTTAGGIDITSSGAAANEDIDISTNASVNVTSTEAAADQIKLSATGTVAGNAINIATTDGGIVLTAGGAANGDITLTSGDDVVITATGDVAMTISGAGTYKGTFLPDSIVKKTITTGSLTSADCGYCLQVAADNQTITLPATEVGLEFWIMCIAPDGGALVILELDNADKFIGAGLAPANGESIRLTKATQHKGDYIKVCHHADGWIITEMNGTWAEETP